MTVRWTLLFFCHLFVVLWPVNSLRAVNLLRDSIANDPWFKYLPRHNLNGKPAFDYSVVNLPRPKKVSSPEWVNITLPLGTERVPINLQPYSNPTQHHFAYLIRRNDSSQIIHENISHARKCLHSFVGDGVKASVDVCDGLSGFILVRDEAYLIRPLQVQVNREKAENQSVPHVIVKLNSSSNKEVKSLRRKRRSFEPKREVKVETAVFVDRDLYRHMMNNYPSHTERHLFRFVLAMINAVQLLYHDDSLDSEVTFVIKRLEILYTDPPNLQRSHDIDRYLSSFCTWQEKENVSWEKSPLHWDHALMLTGLDLYAIGKSGKFSSQVLGLAPVAGMCKPSSSCTVNEGLHFESVYVVAHEIGHNLGMRHDGPTADNDCDSNSYIMSPTLGSGKSSWSACSSRYLAEFLKNPQAQCLFMTTNTVFDHTDGGTLPGERFDADQQCMLKYGKQSERSSTQNLEEICRDLRCTKERYTWTSHPALEGTNCGTKKWCRFGRCIDKEPSKTMGSGRVIDGGWSDWGPFSDCASACLLGNENVSTGSTGIAIATRTCNNPRPENGGKHCFGNDKKYRTCDAMQCSNVPPLTVKEFAEQICRRARDVDNDLIGLGFQRNSSDAEEACTVWCYLYNGGAKSRGWIFPDGTTCHSRTFTSNPMFCVSGRCEEFKCSANNQTIYSATRKHCQSSEFTPIKVTEPRWTPVGPCKYSCVTPASGLRVLKRGSEHNIQLCQSANCNKKTTLFEYATSLCTKYRSRVQKLSGLGVQLSASPEDPDRPCHVACQDEKFSHRFYLVTGEDGWFPFGSDCARGIFGKKSYCVSGKCLEFGKDNMPMEKSEVTFFNDVRRRRSLDSVQNQTVTAMVDPIAVRRFIDALTNGQNLLPEPSIPTIDFDNPIHVSIEWQPKNKTTDLSDTT